MVLCPRTWHPVCDFTVFSFCLPAKTLAIFYLKEQMNNFYFVGCLLFVLPVLWPAWGAGGGLVLWGSQRDLKTTGAPGRASALRKGLGKGAPSSGSSGRGCPRDCPQGRGGGTRAGGPGRVWAVPGPQVKGWSCPDVAPGP